MARDGSAQRCGTGPQRASHSAAGLEPARAAADRSGTADRPHPRSILDSGRCSGRARTVAGLIALLETRHRRLSGRPPATTVEGIRSVAVDAAIRPDELGLDPREGAGPGGIIGAERSEQGATPEGRWRRSASSPSERGKYYPVQLDSPAPLEHPPTAVCVPLGASPSRTAGASLPRSAASGVLVASSSSMLLPGSYEGVRHMAAMYSASSAAARRTTGSTARPARVWRSSAHSERPGPSIWNAPTRRRWGSAGLGEAAWKEVVKPRHLPPQRLRWLAASTPRWRARGPRPSDGRPRTPRRRPRHRGRPRRRHHHEAKRTDTSGTRGTRGWRRSWSAPPHGCDVRSHPQA